MVFELCDQNTTRYQLTSLCCHTHSHNVWDKKENGQQQGGCWVAGTPIQQSCQNRLFTPGIRMYQFPSDLAVRAKWVQFINRHGHDFKNPTTKVVLQLWTNDLVDSSPLTVGSALEILSLYCTMIIR